MEALIHGYLTDKRLKIPLKRLPERVRRLVVGRGGEVEVVFFERIRRWCGYDLDEGFVRVYISVFYYRLLKRLEQARPDRSGKVPLRVYTSPYGWEIHYGDGGLDGRILYLVEDSKALLPGYIKTTKGRIMPLEFYQALSEIEGLRGELGRIRKYRPLVKEVLGFPEHTRIPIQLDIWGREVIFRGRGQTTIYGFPRQ